MNIIWANIAATTYRFIDEYFVETVCLVQNLESYCEIKPKQMSQLYFRAVKAFFYATYH